MLVRRVVDHEVGDDADVPTMRLPQEGLEVGHRAVARRDVVVFGDVVPVVTQGRRIERQEPEAIHSQILEVVEPLRQAAEVADAVPVAILERLDVKLVEDRVLVPEVGHGPGWLGLAPSRARGTAPW
jgi:hypothetical protein